MPNYPAPVLEIIYGTTTINLLAKGKGWHLTGFRPRTAEVKSGATWQSSPLSTGRQPVSYRYDNIIDTWNATADGYDEDGLIELAQELERAGVTALDYWVSDWADTPVYIRARGPKETNTRYAIIHQIRVPEYADQYRQPVFGVGEPVMDGISIIIEHGQWQNVAPGEQECVEVSSVFSWDLASWMTSTTTPTGDVLALLQLPNGRILAGTNNTARVYYSDDNGSSWALLYTIGVAGGDAVNDLKYGGGYVYAAVSGDAAVRGLQRSADNGATWTRLNLNNGPNVAAGTDAYAIVTSSSYVDVYAAFSGGHLIFQSTHGASALVSRNGTAGTSFGMCQLASKRFVWGSATNIIGGPETGQSPSGVVLGNAGTTNVIIQLASGRILAGNSVGSIRYSDDPDGASGSWALLWSGDATTIWDLTQSSDGTVYAGDDGRIWRSGDDGVTWEIETGMPDGSVFSLLNTSDGSLYAADDDSILSYASGEVGAGSSASCVAPAYAGNKAQATNLTSVFVYDASETSYTSIHPMTGHPVPLLPAVPAANDAVYFGIYTTLADITSGPFSSLVFDLAESFVGWTDVEWEYWNGSTWGTLTVTDNTLSLLQTGVNSVHWIPPSNWATTAVDGITGYWVRFRVVSVASSPEPPEQQNRNIYAVVNPFVEVAAAQIGGDIPALARIRIENVSASGGPGGSAPTLYSNRMVMGLRSYSRGALFTAYLNAADEQNPVGVTVTAGDDTAFADAIGAPSGRLAQWSPDATGSWVTILTYSLATTIATQYYGTFRAFLRARQSGGTAGQMQLRLRTSSGSGGISITSDVRTFANTNDHQILDFGQLTLPLTSYLKSSELGDVLTIAVQGNTSSTTPDCNMYDLVLIPVDEWAADLTDGENSAVSALESGYYLDVDSVSFPKRQLRNAVKATGTDYTKAIWQQVANGPAILQANERQRLWLLSMRTAAAASTDWRSEPDVVHRVQMWSAERYRWARGSR